VVPLLDVTVGLLWFEGVLTAERVVVGAVLLTVVVPEGFLVAVLPPLTAVPPAEEAEPFRMADVPPVLVAVVLRVDAVLDMVPELLPEMPFTVLPLLRDALPANTLSDPV
jgi:hypothetical protein